MSRYPDSLSPYKQLRGEIAEDRQRLSQGSPFKGMTEFQTSIVSRHRDMIARAGRSTSDATNGQRRGKAPTQRALASTFEVTKQDVDPLLRKNLH